MLQTRNQNFQQSTYDISNHKHKYTIDLNMTLIVTVITQEL